MRDIGIENLGASVGRLLVTCRPIPVADYGVPRTCSEDAEPSPHERFQGAFCRVAAERERRRYSLVSG